MDNLTQTDVEKLVQCAKSQLLDYEVCGDTESSVIRQVRDLVQNAVIQALLDDSLLNTRPAAVSGLLMVVSDRGDIYPVCIDRCCSPSSPKFETMVLTCHDVKEEVVITGSRDKEYSEETETAPSKHASIDLACPVFKTENQETYTPRKVWRSCTVCKKECRSKWSYYNHMQKEHSSTEKMACLRTIDPKMVKKWRTCGVRHKKYRNKTAYDNHRENYHRDKKTVERNKSNGRSDDLKLKPEDWLCPPGSPEQEDDELCPLGSLEQEAENDESVYEIRAASPEVIDTMWSTITNSHEGTNMRTDQMDDHTIDTSGIHDSEQLADRGTDLDNVQTRETFISKQNKIWRFCRECNQEFKNKSAYYTHKRRNHSSKRLAKDEQKMTTVDRKNKQAKHIGGDEGQGSEAGDDEGSSFGIENGNSVDVMETDRNTFRSKRSLKKRPGDRLPWRNCELCHEECFTKKAYYKHLNKDHPSEKHMCVILRKLQKEEPWKCCKVCKQEFKKKWAYYAHMKKEHADVAQQDGKVQCEECGTFITPSNYSRHVSTHDKEETKDCESRSHSYTEDLVEDDDQVEANKDNEKIRKYWEEFREEGVVYKQCRLCNKQFWTSSAFYNHFKIEHSNVHLTSLSERRAKGCEIWSVCKVCNTEFKNKSAYYTHMKKLHPEAAPTTTRVQCETCGEFVSPANYSRHVLAHGKVKVSKSYKTDRTLIVCQICGKSVQKNSMPAHIKYMHGAEKGPHTCPVCKAVYRSYAIFKRHLEQHKGAKISKCKICQREFRSVEGFKDHMNHHDGVRPYKCINCKASFSFKSVYRLHIKRAHKGSEGAECCKHCGAIVKSLSSHMRKVHNCLLSDGVGYGLIDSSAPTSSVEAKHPELTGPGQKIDPFLTTVLRAEEFTEVTGSDEDNVRPYSTGATDTFTLIIDDADYC